MAILNRSNIVLRRKRHQTRNLEQNALEVKPDTTVSPNIHFLFYVINMFVVDLFTLTDYLLCCIDFRANQTLQSPTSVSNN